MRCWVCGTDDARRWQRSRGQQTKRLTPHDLRITDARYGLTLPLWRCPHCEFVFAADAEHEPLSVLYEDLEDPGYFDTQPARTAQMQWLLQVVLNVQTNAHHLLDIGAGSGLLVAEARRQGLEAEGVEPSLALVRGASALNDVDVIRGVFPTPALADRRFDIVCLVDVIEHVTDPVVLLRHCAVALAPGGVVMVVTPDLGSLAARVMGRRWWHFRLAHVGYFNARSLERAATEAGLQIVTRFRPRWFFRIGYLARRLTRYLPVGRFNRAMRRFGPLRRAYDRVVPVNLHDSLGVILRRAEDRA